jgi:CarboxypepD_reg-like domain
MRTIILFFFALIPMAAIAQDSRLLVMGTIRSEKEMQPLEGVLVSCESPARQTYANKGGRYAILLDKKPGQVLQFKMLGYKTAYRIINADLLKKASGDTLRLDLVLQVDTKELTTFVMKSGADTVIGNWRFYIEDYAILNDSQYVLLTFEKSLKAAKVMLSNNKEIQSSIDVPGEAQQFFRDYQGHLNVMCKDSAFRVKIVPPARVLLLALPYADFCARMLPCVDTSGGQILFSNYSRNYPAFTYFAFNPYDTSIHAIRTVMDRELLAQYNWEFDYLKPKDRLYARKMSAFTGIDPRIVAATMTGFPHSIYYTPLYAPMEVIHDTICIFDHYADSLFLYNRNMQPIGASKIGYHRPTNWKEWDRKIIRDEVTGEVYAQFEKDGFYTLKKIDLATGKIVGTYKIGNQFIKHIHIRNGEVYYVYKPFDSLQKKFLYKETIQLN